MIPDPNLARGQATIVGLHGLDFIDGGYDIGFGIGIQRRSL